MFDKSEYLSEPILKENYEYRFVLTIGSETQEFVFYTKLNPFYTTKKRVKQTLPFVFKEIPESYLDLLIYENSKLAYEIANEDLKSELDKENVPSIIERYTRLKTQVDIITDIAIDYGLKTGSAEKILGDFKISYEVKTPDLEKLLKRLERELEYLERAITNKIIALTATRAGAIEYPFSGRADF
ncbi:MAG: hypothetical protein N2043_02250 [Ignavibacterium sp.]|nr:hypothetical protein [Ignavibacterium sp.]